VEELARRPLVAGLRRTLRQLERDLDNVLVRDKREQVVDAVEAGAPLIVALNDIPGRLRDIGSC
jgi:hypothetical protein